jgi:4-amino-4-deoxy-L-arabinose transferase-like glycosyltransferase
VDIALPVGLLLVTCWVTSTDLLHWPAAQFDEGTYTSYAWAVGHGKLANYTYSYGHPPLAWILIFVWTWAGGLFGHARFSIDAGREFMAVLNLFSCWLLYVLARRLNFGRVAASTSVLLFALSPLAVWFHRAALLDNPATVFMLGAFVLVRSPERRLWALASGGACFALAVLSKETTLVLLPALALAAVQNADRRTRRYALTLFGAFFILIAVSYPLYATLKGELLPGRGHVSMLGYAVVQLFTRKGTGSVFDPHSQTHAIVAGWLKLDPLLLAAALVLTPLAVARRSTRSASVAFLIQVVMVLRPGYLPNMYVIGMLPFAALTVGGGVEALWRWTEKLAYPRAARSLAVVLAASAAVSAVLVGNRWWATDRVAMTVRQDRPARGAEAWLVQHVGHDKRLIVDDEVWIYLIEHGFDSHPVRGGFYSRTVVSYWPLDYDPAVKRRFPHGWRDFDYIVSTQAMRDTTGQTPTAATAYTHSRLVAVFGRGPTRVEVRAIERNVRQ